MLVNFFCAAYYYDIFMMIIGIFVFTLNLTCAEFPVKQYTIIIIIRNSL